MTPAGAAPTAPDRPLWPVVLLVAAWFINLGCSIVGWENTLIGRFEFRQVQTALTAAHLPAYRLPLAYETPVFGPPWSVPLEFPLYEASASTLAAVTGLPLDSAGRLASWLWFQAALPALFLVAGSFGLRREARLVGLALVLTSPLFLFFSRAFQIEATALACCAWFLAALGRWLERRQVGWLVVASIAGALGASVKVTTMVVFGVGALALAFDAWRQRGMAPARVAGRTLAALAVPALVGLAWLVFSTEVRNRNPNAEILNTHFGFWSFGDLPQRLSAGYWTFTVSVWFQCIASEAGMILGLYLFFRHRGPVRRVALTLFLVFLSGQLIFSNLYRVHDYYFYASAAFLLFALAHLLGENADPGLPRWGRVALPALVMLCQLADYARDYLPYQRQNASSTPLIEIVRDLTRPTDTIVFIGFDWNATTAYYAGRRALMFTNGREWKRAEVKRYVDQLDPATIGAIVIKGGLGLTPDYLVQNLGHLAIELRPLLVNHDDQISVWFPRARRAELADRLPNRPYPTFDLEPLRPQADGPHLIGHREISQRHEFERMHPRPYKASAPGDFSLSVIEGERVLNAHAASRLWFRIRPGMTQVRARFGIDDRATVGPEHTDGVEFSVVFHGSDGSEKVLLRRFLDPVNRRADQGRQEADFPLPTGQEGELEFRTGPGPRDNFSFDWAYWAEIDIR